MSSAPAANTYVEHSGASDAGCAWLRRGGGALARHRCVRDVMSCSLRCEPPHISRQGSLGISCATERNNGTGSEGRGGMVRVLYGERLTTLVMIIRHPV